MAVQATLIQPVPDLAAIENVAGLPFGGMITPYEMTTAVDFTVDSQFVSGRFPTPAAALGFLTDVYDENGDPPYRIPPDGILSGAGGQIYGALSPAGPYLEPTIGQIWPR